MPSIQDWIRLAIAEDVGSGDHTSLAILSDEAQGKARFVAKSEGIMAGVEVAREVFQMIDPNVSFETLCQDGQRFQRGDVLARLKGRSISILSGERLSLNFMQRMCGIATHTRTLVDLISGTGARLLDTRKTTPNQRLFEKMAVAIGGGCNHRWGLYDMILIKDNHIDFAGGIPQALEACHNYIKTNGLDLKIEIEVRSMNDIQQVLSLGGVDRIMLDNFSPEMMREAVHVIDHRFETEASGGITQESIRSYALTGVDYISVGALTHHIQSKDISLLAD